ncbi:hypothetical protein [Timonella sp. A28]|uniref:hypothetical protein n=1 Tax=Timonella sp. A28 TaxID=3442640 RepID=UPI003EBB735F
MRVFPDSDVALQQHGLSLVGIEVLPRECGEGPTLDEVSAFFAARKVLASVGLGERFGSTAQVVVNCAAFEDDYLAVASQADTVGRGQHIEEFLRGLAYGLDTTVIADGTVIVGADGSFQFYEGLGEDAPCRSLTVMSSPGLHSVSNIVFSNTDVYGYMRVENHGLLLSEKSALPGGHLLVFDEKTLPLTTFVVDGDVRTVHFSAVKNAPPLVTLHCGPSFDAVCSPPLGSTARDVEQLLIELPKVIIDDEDLTRRQQKSLKSGSPSGRAYSQLTAAASDLVSGESVTFFERVAQVLHFSPAVIAALQDFQEQSVTQQKSPREYGYAVFDHALLRNTRSLLAPEAIFLSVEINKKYIQKNNYVSTSSLMKRTVRTASLMTVFCGILGVSALLSMVVPSIRDTLDINIAFPLTLGFIFFYFTGCYLNILCRRSMLSAFFQELENSNKLISALRSSHSTKESTWN